MVAAEDVFLLDPEFYSLISGSVIHYVIYLSILSLKTRVNYPWNEHPLSCKLIRGNDSDHFGSQHIPADSIGLN